MTRPRRIAMDMAVGAFFSLAPGLALHPTEVEGLRSLLPWVLVGPAGVLLYHLWIPARGRLAGACPKAGRVLGICLAMALAVGIVWLWKAGGLFPFLHGKHPLEIGPLLLIRIVIAGSLEPYLVIPALGACGALLGWAVRTGRMRGWMAAAAFPFVAFHMAALFLLVYRMGSLPSSCRRVGGGGEVEQVLGRQEIRRLVGRADLAPYDVMPSEDGTSALFLTLKSAYGSEGRIVRYDRETKKAEVLTPAEHLPSVGSSVFAERMERDRARGRIYVIVYSFPSYYLLDLPSEPPLTVDRVVPLAGEPNSLFLDIERDRLLVLFGGAGRTGLDLLALPSMETVRQFADPPLVGSFQYAELDGGTYFLSSVGAPFGTLFTLDARGLALGEWVGGWRPLTGLALDRRAGRVYAGCPLTGGVEIFSAHPLARIGGVHVGGTPSALALDERARRLLVGDYGGWLKILPLDNLADRVEHWVGRPLRSLRLDPDSGTVWIASGCGVFAMGG